MKTNPCPLCPSDRGSGLEYGGIASDSIPDPLREQIQFQFTLETGSGTLPARAVPPIWRSIRRHAASFADVRCLQKPTRLRQNGT